jgi:hypothetical protein
MAGAEAAQAGDPGDGWQGQLLDGPRDVGATRLAAGLLCDHEDLHQRHLVLVVDRPPPACDEPRPRRSPR